MRDPGEHLLHQLSQPMIEKGYFPMEDIQLKKYARKPFYVDAIQVTHENMDTVKDWCDGTLKSDEEGRYFIQVKVQRPQNERQTKAYAGDWILHASNSFKVYNAKAFAACFEPKDKPGIVNLELPDLQHGVALSEAESEIALS